MVANLSLDFLALRRQRNATYALSGSSVRGVGSGNARSARPRWVTIYSTVTTVAMVGGMFALSVAVSGLWTSVILFGILVALLAGSIRLGLRIARARNPTDLS